MTCQGACVRAIACFQGLAYESVVDVPIDKPQEMIFGNVNR